MAEIAAFRGIRYSAKAGDPGKLLAPPYEVISPAEQAQLAALDPHNCVRFILPRSDEAKAILPRSDEVKAKDPRKEKGKGKEAKEVKEVKSEDADAKYAAGIQLYRQWLSEGVLARDAEPAIYRYHQVFDLYGKEMVRKGFVARVRLAKFDGGVALAHEQTPASSKVDQLKLMREARAHFAQSFALYDDKEHRADAIFEEIEKQPPDMDAKMADGVTHRLWRLTNAAALQKLIDYMDNQKIYVVDEHHQYENMLNLSEELCKEAPSPNSAAAFGTMFFCNMDDPGLVTMPMHRVLFGLPKFNRQDLMRRATEFFRVVEGPLGNAEVMRQALKGHTKRNPTLAMVTPGASTAVYFQLRGDLRKDSVPSLAVSKALADLDVTFLHALIFENLLGIDRLAQEKQTNVRYIQDWSKAFAEVDAPGVQAVFFLNPTKVEHVRAIVDEGLTMPPQSTFFTPQNASCLIINPIDPTEEIAPQ